MTAINGENYKEKREREKAQEFAAALAKSQGKRLTDVHIEEVAGLSKHDGLNDVGKLTPKGIFMVLQHLGIIAKSTDPDLADKNLIIKKGKTGTFSNQLFVVTVQPILLKNPQLGSTFVIKGLQSQGVKIEHSKINTPQKEVQNLLKVKEFIVPQLEKVGVQLSSTAGVCWYTDMLNEKQYLAILNVAHGKSLSDWSNDYLQGKIDVAKWKKIMGTIGKVVGLIHYTLATPQSKVNLQKGIVDWRTFLTTVHGDLHPENGFVDDVTGQATPIDSASMADSLNEKTSPLKDLADINLKMKYMLQFNNAKGFGWLNEGFESFIDEYVSSFPEKCQDALKKAIFEKFYEWSHAIFNHFQTNGFAAYTEKGILTEIISSMIVWFKADKLDREKVVAVLKTDPMAVHSEPEEGKDVHKPFRAPLNP